LTFYPKIERCHLLVMNNHHTILKFLGLRFLRFLIGNRFYLKGKCDLDL
jgi:hypothetical protein